MSEQVIETPVEMHIEDEDDNSVHIVCMIHDRDTALCGEDVAGEEWANILQEDEECPMCRIADDHFESLGKCCRHDVFSVWRWRDE